MIFNQIVGYQEKQIIINNAKEYLKQKRERQIQKMNEHNKLIEKRNKYNKMNTDFILKNKYNSIIPLIFYTSWHTKELPPKMKENYDLLVETNPEFTHYLFDENDCREFIKNNFDNQVLYAYNSLIPCSYKSDLWRYCVLYKTGGIYMDIKYKCVNGFKLVALTEDEFFVRDRPYHMSYNALICVKPGNEILLKCINNIVENVNKKYYGPNSLSPTGPALLGSFFSLEDIDNMKIYFTDVSFTDNNIEEFMVYNNKVILKYYDGYRIEQAKYQKNKRYGELWDDRNIYYNYK